jgi:adenylyltransferase/sulfurtransferase
MPLDEPYSPESSAVAPPGARTPVPAEPLAVVAQPLSDQERYSRQVLFPGIGLHGQQRLARAHAAIVGCGATGAAVASLLARAGVGTLTIIDRDFVEPSNLQRQVLFDEDDARQSLPKAEAARRHIARFNSGIHIHARIADLTPANIANLLGPAHLILDATDNFETRYLLNDYAVQNSIPWIYAAAIGGYAATMNILPTTISSAGDPGSITPPTACLACIFPQAPSGNVETCDTAGILATAVNLAASIQATEALKLLTGQPQLVRRTLLSFDLWNPTGASSLENSQISASTPRPGCPVCGQRTFAYLAGQNRPHITLCGRDSVQIHEHHHPIDFNSLRRRLSNHADIRDIRSNDMLLRFRRGPHTLTVFSDGRAIVQGTTDVAVARTLYARFLGA